MENWRKYLTEDWRDTSWEDDGEKITIGQVDDYLGDKTICVIPSDVRDQVLKSQGKDSRLPTTSQDRIDKADLSFPIIVVMEDGKYTYVLDGNHRLQKAVEQGEPLKARVLNLEGAKTPENFKKMFGIAK
jgi:hypothetical protein